MPTRAATGPRRMPTRASTTTSAGRRRCRSTPGRTLPPPTTAACSRSTSTVSRPRPLVVSGPIVTNTGALRIGGNTIWGEYFNGLIDEVRIYSRALSAAEIQTDMNRSVTAPDATPPSAPGTLTATGGLGQISLAWGAATDNVGVARYDVYRSTTQRLHPEHRQPDRAADRHRLHRHRSRPRHLLLQGRRRRRRRQHRPSRQRGERGRDRPTRPRRRSRSQLPARGATVSGAVTVTANASDNGSVAGVQFKVDGANLGAEDTAAPYSASWDTLSTANGPHTLRRSRATAPATPTTSSGGHGHGLQHRLAGSRRRVGVRRG